jgi:hypothetical protein
VTSKHYEIHLDGVHATDVSLTILRDLADLLLEGAARSARLAVEGRSTARGALPAWLASAGDVRLRAIREGSLAIDVAARPLNEIVPGALPPSSSTTAFDLFLRAAADALQERSDSEQLDSGILQTLLKSRALFARGVSQVRITDSAAHHAEPLLLTETSTEAFLKLANQLPSPHVDRCVAILDSLTMSTHSCSLKLEDGASLRGDLAPAVDLEAVRALLGREVLAEGTAYFRPSGRAHRMEIDFLAPATLQDEVWRRAPHGEARPEHPLPSSGELSSLVGQWPGEESDDRIFEALRELS